MAHGSSDSVPTPVILLKTKSQPADAYEEHFAVLDNHAYQPIFVPVLKHQFSDISLKSLKRIIESGAFDPTSNTSGPDFSRYGGLIFTSQRAVEAFTEVICDLRTQHANLSQLLPETLPLYVVGPATARALQALSLGCQIKGDHTGNGDALAAFILQDFNSRSPAAEARRLLFLVGEQRRDIIPKTLQDSDLAASERIAVEEMVVYETTVMETFASLFGEVVRSAHERQLIQWVVVFSPTGCEAMLNILGFLDEATGRVRADVANGQRTTYIATIGPTTRNYLTRKFGFEPDATAKTPSPEGVSAAIQAFVPP